MKITIEGFSKQPMNGYDRRRTTPHIYFFLTGESVLENLANRRNRPHMEFKKEIPSILRQAGFTEDQIKTAKPSWSQKCGCSCGCSPGFRLKDAPWSFKEDIFVDVKISA